MTFKEWLSTEGMTSFALVRMLPHDGNADWNRCDVNSKLSAKASSCAEMPPAGVKKRSKPKHPPEPSFMGKDPTGYGFDAEDKKKAKPRSDLRYIDRRRRTVPIRTPEVYD